MIPFILSIQRLDSGTPPDILVPIVKCASSGLLVSCLSRENNIVSIPEQIDNLQSSVKCLKQQNYTVILGNFPTSSYIIKKSNQTHEKQEATSKFNLKTKINFSINSFSRIIITLFVSILILRFLILYFLILRREIVGDYQYKFFIIDNNANYYPKSLSFPYLSKDELLNLVHETFETKKNTYSMLKSDRVNNITCHLVLFPTTFSNYLLVLYIDSNFEDVSSNDNIDIRNSHEFRDDRVDPEFIKTFTKKSEDLSVKVCAVSDTAEIEIFQDKTDTKPTQQAITLQVLFMLYYKQIEALFSGCNDFITFKKLIFNFMETCDFEAVELFQESNDSLSEIVEFHTNQESQDITREILKLYKEDGTKRVKLFGKKAALFTTECTEMRYYFIIVLSQCEVYHVDLETQLSFLALQYMTFYHINFSPYRMDVLRHRFKNLISLMKEPIYIEVNASERPEIPENAKEGVLVSTDDNKFIQIYSETNYDEILNRPIKSALIIDRTSYQKTKQALEAAHNDQQLIRSSLHLHKLITPQKLADNTLQRELGFKDDNLNLLDLVVPEDVPDVKMMSEKVKCFRLRTSEGEELLYSGIANETVNGEFVGYVFKMQNTITNENDINSLISPSIMKYIAIWSFERSTGNILLSLSTQTNIKKIDELALSMEESQRQIFLGCISSVSPQNTPKCVVHFFDPNVNAYVWFEFAFFQTTPSAVLVIALNVDETKNTNDKLTEVQEIIDQSLYHADIVKWSFYERDTEQHIFMNSPLSFETLRLSWSSINFQVPLDFQERARKAFEDCLRDGTPIEVEIPIIFESLQWLYLRGGRGDVPGTLFGVYFDTTELIEMKNELEAEKESAIEALSAKTDFLARLSSEVREPLQYMLAVLELMFMLPSSDELKKTLTLVRSSFDRLSELLTDTLDLSRIDSGNLTPTYSTFDLIEILEPIVNDARHQVRGRDIKVYFNCPPQVALKLYGDPLIMKRVVSNVVSNAVKFTEKGKIIVDISEETTAGITISVSDTGIGIALDQQESIFDTFTQIDGSITRPYGGSGIGLSVVTKLMKLVGGNVMVSSEIDKGSVFKLFFPYDVIYIPYVPESIRSKRCSLAFAYQHVISPIIKTYTDFYGGEIQFYPDLSDTPPSILFIMPEKEQKELASNLKKQYPDLIVITVYDSLDGENEPLSDGEMRVIRPLLPSVLRQILLRAKSFNPKISSASANIVQKTVFAVKANILMADDNVTSQIIMSKILDKMECTHCCVSSGREVLKELSAQKYNVLIVDQGLPDISLKNLMDEIRARDIQGVRVIALTSSAPPANDCGVDMFLTKPVSMVVLAEAIKKQLEIEAHSNK